MVHKSKSFEIIKNDTTGMLNISIGDSKGMRAFMDEDGAIWFCLRDVLSAMGTKTRPADAKVVISDLFGAGSLKTTQLDTGFGVKPTTFVNESGTTYLIAQGNTSTSKALNVKIHQDIIPSIRKTGRYEEKPTQNVPDSAQKILEGYQLFSAMVEDQKANIEAQRQIIRKSASGSAKQAAKIIADKPKVEYFERTVQITEGSISLEEAAKTLSIPHPRKFNAILKNGIAFGRFSNRYKWLKDTPSKIMPLTNTINNGLMEFKQIEVTHANGATSIFRRPMVTQKGLHRLSELFDLDDLPPELFAKSSRS